LQPSTAILLVAGSHPDQHLANVTWHYQDTDKAAVDQEVLIPGFPAPAQQENESASKQGIAQEEKRIGAALICSAWGP
jgi:hypothetical protein